MELRIESHVGVGPLRLGMIKNDARRILGPPSKDFIRSPYSWGVEWMYRPLGIDLMFDSRNSCAGILLVWPSDPEFHGVRLLHVPAPEAWDLVRSLDPGAFEENDSLISRELGMSIFAPTIADDEPDEPASNVIVFRSDYLDLG